MNIKAFFVDALTAALDLNIGTPDDVLRHVTPDVLAAHLPRPLWARMLTACLGAPRVDAQLVVETIGIANLCEHVPSTIIWSCIAEIGARSLGKDVDVATPPGPLAQSPSGRAMLAPPPDVAPPVAPLAIGTGVAPVAPAAVGPSIPPPAPGARGEQPIGDVLADLERTDEPVRPRTSTSTRFRQSSTSVSRGPGLGSRRPQVAAPVPVGSGPLSRSGGRRTSTEVTNPEPEPETNVQAGWGDKEIAVDDSQLVDWQTDVGAASAITGDDDFSDLGRKR